MAAETLEFIQTNHFFDQHQDTLQQLGAVVGLPNNFLSSLETAVALTQPWVQGDHGHGSYEFNLTAEQKPVLQQHFEALDLVEQHDLPAGHYDQILVLGAVHLGNDKRLRYLRQMMDRGDITTDRIVMMGGERKMFQEREPEDVLKSLESLHAKDYSDGWLTNFMKKPPAERDETDLLRLAALDHLGPLAVKQMYLRHGAYDPSKLTVPQYRSDFEWCKTPVSLTHTELTDRKNGDARHTTEKCIQDWVKIFEPAPGSTMGFISSQPHLERMVRSARRVLLSLNRDIKLVPGGPGTTLQTGETIYLGEVARSLYEDKEALL